MARDTNETATPARSASAPTNDSPKPPPIPPQESSASLPLPNTHSPRGSIPIQELDHESDHHQQPMTHFSESTDTHHHSDDDDSISVGSSVKSGLLHDDDARDEQEDQGLEEEDGFDVPDIHVLVGTFNLATRVLNLESGSGVPDLSPWLNPPHTSTKKPQHANGSSTTTTSNNLTIKTPSNSPPPDIVVVGFQELLSQYKAAWLPMRERSYGTAKLAVRHEEAWMQSLRNWVTLVQETLQDAYGSYTSPQGSDSDPAAAGVNAGTTDDLGPIKTSARTFDSLADRARYDLALDRKDSGIASSVAPEEKPPKAKSRHHGKTDSNSIFSTSSEEEASSSSDSGNYSPEIERIRYEPYSMSRMTALGLAVFVRVDPHSRVKIRGVWEGSMGTGLLGTYGNKGVEAIGLDIDVFEDMYLISRRLSLAFVNSHLGPHEGFDYFTWRNEELEHILRTLLFTSTVTPFGIRTIDDFHANFFFGDMNYRLIGAGVTDQRDRAVFRRSVLNYIDAKDVEALVEVDELTVLRDRQKFEPLAGFVESPIQFLPSYKYNVDSQLPTSTTTTTTTTKNGRQVIPQPPTNESVLSTPSISLFSSKRIPAYCDRILYRATYPSLPPRRRDHIGWEDDQVSFPITTPDNPKRNHVGKETFTSRQGRRVQTSLESDTPQETVSSSSSSNQDSSSSSSSWQIAKSHSEQSIRVIYYHCAQNVLWSDHKPVSALFALNVDKLLEPYKQPRPEPSSGSWDDQQGFDVVNEGGEESTTTVRNRYAAASATTTPSNPIPHRTPSSTSTSTSTTTTSYLGARTLTRTHSEEDSLLHWAAVERRKRFMKSVVNNSVLQTIVVCVVVALVVGMLARVEGVRRSVGGVLRGLIPRP